MTFGRQKQTFLSASPSEEGSFCTQKKEMSNKTSSINKLLKTSRNIFLFLLWGIVGNCVTLRTKSYKQGIA